MMVTKKANASKMRKEKHEIDVEAIKSWIRARVDQMIQIADLEIDLKTQLKALEEVQSEIDQEVEQKASQ